MLCFLTLVVVAQIFHTRQTELKLGYSIMDVLYKYTLLLSTVATTFTVKNNICKEFLQLPNFFPNNQLLLTDFSFDCCLFGVNHHLIFTVHNRLLILTCIIMMWTIMGLKSEEVTEHAAFELLPPPSPLHLSSAPHAGTQKEKASKR